MQTYYISRLSLEILCAVLDDQCKSLIPTLAFEAQIASV